MSPRSPPRSAANQTINVTPLAEDYERRDPPEKASARARALTDIRTRGKEAAEGWIPGSGRSRRRRRERVAEGKGYGGVGASRTGRWEGSGALPWRSRGAVEPSGWPNG